MGSIARKHAEPISKITYDDLPPEVIEKTKTLLAHCLGSVCIGPGGEVDTIRSRNFD